MRLGLYLLLQLLAFSNHVLRCYYRTSSLGLLGVLVDGHGQHWFCQNALLAVLVAIANMILLFENDGSHFGLLQKETIKETMRVRNMKTSHN
jgi:hypothetical protein